MAIIHRELDCSRKLFMRKAEHSVHRFFLQTQHEEKKVTTRYLKILRFQMKALVAMAKYLHGNVDFSVLDVHSVLLSINGWAGSILIVFFCSNIYYIYIFL